MWSKYLKYFPFVVVLIASVIMFWLIQSGEPSTRTFPSILFIFAKLSTLFAAVELCLAYVGSYREQKEVYQSLSRAITSFGMAMCFILLIGAFEASKGLH